MHFTKIKISGSTLWPVEETDVFLDGKKFTLRPQTSEYQAEIEANSRETQLSEIKTLERINRFLSLLCYIQDNHGGVWCDEVSRTSVKQKWRFNRISPLSMIGINWAFPTFFSLPESESTRKCLASFREGCNALGRSDGYACLSFYRVIEHAKGPGRNRGTEMNKLIESLVTSESHHKGRAYDLSIKKAAESGKSLPNWIYSDIRNYIAHYASEDPFDLDSAEASSMLAPASNVLRDLAHAYIKHQLKLDCHLLSHGSFSSSL